MSTKNGIMKGKRGVIMGVANDLSLAWGITKALADQGAELAFTYQSEAILKRLSPLVSPFENPLLVPCDVSKEGDIAAAFSLIKEKWGKIDFVVHAIAFADKDELKGPYLNTSKSNFALSMNISCYSFTEVCRKAAPLMTEGGSFLTLTYLGAERFIPNYNVMGVAKAALEASVMYLAADLGPQGIRVNALSAGPVKTLAAMGISDFRGMLKWTEECSPLRRNTTLEDVGGTGLYLLSDLSSGVTGEIIHVDSGYHIMGMKPLDKEA